MNITFWIYYGTTANFAISFDKQLPVPRPAPKWPHLFWFGAVISYGFKTD